MWDILPQSRIKPTFPLLSDTIVQCHLSIHYLISWHVNANAWLLSLTNIIFEFQILWCLILDLFDSLAADPDSVSNINRAGSIK